MFLTVQDRGLKSPLLQDQQITLKASFSECTLNRRGLGDEVGSVGGLA